VTSGFDAPPSGDQKELAGEVLIGPTIKKCYRILGIDPGTRVAGYGIVDCSKRSIEPIAVGCWELGKAQPLYERLGKLAREFDRLVTHYKPTHICVEDVFVAKFSRSALVIGHARGVIMARAHACGLVYQNMMPTEAKRRITGMGHASKEQVAKMILSLLGLTQLKDLPHDATDGLALAYAFALDLQKDLKTLKTSDSEAPQHAKDA
jgi:crossover junction endodeoxyribonuclease RuvC